VKNKPHIKRFWDGFVWRTNVPGQAPFRHTDSKSYSSSTVPEKPNGGRTWRNYTRPSQTLDRAAGELATILLSALPCDDLPAL
jgi:hypothetical protein